MALSPSIPTSFVPKQPVSTGNHRYSNGSNLLLIIALIITGITLVLAAGVFLYSAYLSSVEKSKGAELVAAQTQANETNVEDFVRLRDRLSAAKDILSQHIALSQFFTVLEGVTLQNVQFDNLKIDVADDRTAKITMLGTAKTFNALAAESTAFAAQPDIKSAIFSSISANKDGTVNFELDADLDSNLVVEKNTPAAPALLPAAAANTASSTPIQDSLAPTATTPAAPVTASSTPATTPTPTTPVVTPTHSTTNTGTATTSTP